MNVCNVKYCKEAVKLHLSHNSINSPSSSIQPLSLLPYLYTFGGHYFYIKRSIHNHTEDQIWDQSFKLLGHVDAQQTGKQTLYSVLGTPFQPQWSHSSNSKQFQWRCPHWTQQEEWLWSKESTALSLFSATLYRFSSRLQTAAAGRKRLSSLLWFVGAAERWWEKSSFSPWWHEAVSYQNTKAAANKIKITN